MKKKTGNQICRSFENYGELSADEKNILATFLGGLDVRKPKEFESALYAYKGLSNDLEDIKMSIKDLKAVEARVTEQLEMVANYIENAPERDAVTSYSTGSYECSVKTSKASNIIDEASIPAMYLKTKVTSSVDKAAVLAALKAGETVNGAELVINKKITVKGGEEDVS